MGSQQLADSFMRRPVCKLTGGAAIAIDRHRAQLFKPGPSFLQVLNALTLASQPVLQPGCILFQALGGALVLHHSNERADLALAVDDLRRIPTTKTLHD